MRIKTYLASKQEQRRAMPADSLVSDPIGTMTHAVTIYAPPESVWPWLAQMGGGRAGWYSYDRIDNGGHPSAESILAEYRQIAPGSPTRSALLTGRNHHTVGFGAVTEMATSAPGYDSLRPNSVAPLAEILKLNGYSTAQIGKCHEIPVWQTSPMGPFDAWPSGGGGFEYFYGFLGGDTHQYYPGIYEGTTALEAEKTPEEGYHFTEDMTTKAIKWVRQQKSLMPDKPFFMYYAPGATHAPHHVPAEWADKYNVLPLDDRFLERINADMAGRPQLVHGDSQLLFGGMGRLTENSVINIKNKSHSVTAELEIPASGADGVIIAQGGAGGGWSFYAHKGKLKYCYNLVGRQYFYAESASTLPAGTHQVRIEFAYDGGGIGKGGNITLYVDGKKEGEGRVDRTIPFVFSLDETCDIGSEAGSPVSPDYGVRDNDFNGEVNWVQIDVGKDDFDHLISPEERLNFAIMRQ